MRDEQVKITVNDGNVFYYTEAVENNTCYLWLYYLGCPYEAENFSCTFSMKNKTGETFSYSGPVHTLDESKDSIITSGSCFNIRIRALLRPLGVRGELCITIRNLKEEAKDDDEESGLSDDERILRGLRRYEQKNRKLYVH